MKNNIPDLVFTTIEIETVFENKKYTASFKAVKDFLMEIKITGKSIKECIENCSKFLDCEITEKHYTIKP